jgi:hypothetical protein
MPAATNSYTIEALKGQAVTAQLKETVNQVTQRVGRRIFEHALRYSGYVVFFYQHLHPYPATFPPASPAHPSPAVENAIHSLYPSTLGVPLLALPLSYTRLSLAPLARG